MALLTPVNQLHNAGTVSVSCNRCHRVVPLDLPAMVARGLGDRPLVELPLWCRACGSRSFGLICLTGHTGPGRRVAPPGTCQTASGAAAGAGGERVESN